jgi:hypothetical protein
MQDSSFQIDGTLIGDGDSIEARVAVVTESDRDALRWALGYLYLDDGPISVARDSKMQAEQYFTPVELFVFQWLHKRTDGIPISIAITNCGYRRKSSQMGAPEQEVHGRIWPQVPFQRTSEK